MAKAIEAFGGLDILIINDASQAEEVSLLLQAALPFLELGIDPSISILGTNATNAVQSIRLAIGEQSSESIRISAIDPNSQTVYGSYRSAKSTEAPLSNETVTRLVTSSASESHS